MLRTTAFIGTIGNCADVRPKWQEILNNREDKDGVTIERWWLDRNQIDSEFRERFCIRAFSTIGTSISTRRMTTIWTRTWVKPWSRSTPTCIWAAAPRNSLSALKKRPAAGRAKWRRCTRPVADNADGNGTKASAEGAIRLCCRRSVAGAAPVEETSVRRLPVLKCGSFSDPANRLNGSGTAGHGPGQAALSRRLLHRSRNCPDQGNQASVTREATACRRTIPKTAKLASDLSAVTDIDIPPSDARRRRRGRSASDTGIRASADVAEGATVTYSLLDDAGGLFSIDPETGIVTVAGALDAETAGSTRNRCAGNRFGWRHPDRDLHHHGA